MHFPPWKLISILAIFGMPLSINLIITDEMVEGGMCLDFRISIINIIVGRCSYLPSSYWVMSEGAISSPVNNDQW
ncbi:unnamed protein product [Haemonchus placei]|uniref:Secreted protein n=1 Tax=Haemonchus placei TaxID=6290 RepID=A0A0N4WYE7_HAEPC|nr:unnamed protein product [Haemonchus placei]